jgi:cytochrome c2
MRHAIKYIALVIFLSSCWHQQWEDRVASGDTGSVTHGKYEKSNASIPDTTTYVASDIEQLFNGNCSSCHNLSSKMSTGPGLMGVLDRIPSHEWAYAFIRNADSLVRSGDAYANKLYSEYNYISHPKFPKLSKDEINDLLDYCSAAP